MLKINLINKPVFILIIILLITYFTSFAIKGKNGNDKREKINTVLLNPKNLEKIECIELSKDSSFVILQKIDDFWILLNNDNSPIPANTEFLNNFLIELSNFKDLYKISDNITNNNNYGLQESNTFHIKYTLNDGPSQELFFGNLDFSQSYRYFMTGRNLTVYQIDSSLEKYLSTSVQNWADPYLISHSVINNLKNEDIQRIIYSEGTTSKKINTSSENFYNISDQLINLRHGGIGYRNLIVEENLLFNLKIELGDKKEILLEFFPSSKDSNDYIIRTTYGFDSKHNYLFYSKISIWTYKSIKDMML